jgi:hypothetical protein
VQRTVEGSEFNARYDDGAADVQQNAELKRAVALDRFREAVTYLAQQQEMIDAGFIEDDPDNNQDVALQSGLNGHFGGVGSKYRSRRTKMVKDLNSQADTMGFPLTSSQKRDPVVRKRS